MKRADAFPSQYLQSSDIAGRKVRCVIEHIATETVGQDEEQRQKPVMYFKNGSKGLVVNATNWDTLADAYGEESDNWIGKSVVLHVVPTKFKGKATTGIRMKIPDKKAPIPIPQVQLKPVEQVQEEEEENENPAEGMDDEIPF